MLQASGLIGTTMVKFNVKVRKMDYRYIGIIMVRKSEGSYLQGKRVGHWEFWHSNGSKWSEGNYN